jgi:hypothetical protein
VTESSAPAERSYGCTFGCGNPYDYILIDVQSSTTEFLCLPDFIRLAADMVTAATDPDDKLAMEAAAYVAVNGEPAAPGPKGKRRGHNAPATNESADVFAAYDSLITADELGDEFR